MLEALKACRGQCVGDVESRGCWEKEGDATRRGSHGGGRRMEAELSKGEIRQFHLYQKVVGDIELSIGVD
jgi:hypothetical protein